MKERTDHSSDPQEAPSAATFQTPAIAEAPRIPPIAALCLPSSRYFMSTPISVGVIFFLILTQKINDPRSVRRWGQYSRRVDNDTPILDGRLGQRSLVHRIPTGRNVQGQSPKAQDPKTPRATTTAAPGAEFPWSVEHAWTNSFLGELGTERVQDLVLFGRHHLRLLCLSAGCKLNCELGYC